MAVYIIKTDNGTKIKEYKQLSAAIKFKEKYEKSIRVSCNVWKSDDNNNLTIVPSGKHFIEEPKEEQQMILKEQAAAQLSYYDYKDIDAQDAVYNLIIGQRSNGKTYGICKKIVDAYINHGLPSAYIRRLDEMLKSSVAEDLFKPLAEYIDKISQKRYNGVIYYNRAYYMVRYAEDANGVMQRVAKDPTPFCRTYAINVAENSKGADRGAVKYIVFDEFITRKNYITNEFVHFQNLLSSIIRDRDNVKIYMLANTVNQYCPYFAEMGLKEIDTMQQGEIAVYKVGQTKTKIAVEYCATASATRKVSKYFAFDNPQLQMITNGAWEVALYRKAPDMAKYDIIFSFFISFSGKLVQGDIYDYEGYPIIVYHLKTTPLQHPDRDIIYYEDTIDSNPLHCITLNDGTTRAHKMIKHLITTNKTFYAGNVVGEIVNNWLKNTALVGKLTK